VFLAQCARPLAGSGPSCTSDTPGVPFANQLAVNVASVGVDLRNGAAVAIGVHDLELDDLTEDLAGESLLRPVRPGLTALGSVDLGETDLDWVPVRHDGYGVAVRCAHHPAGQRVGSRLSSTA